MDKRSKHQRHKTLSRDELADLGSEAAADTSPDTGPERASFDTEAGRAAQGMRPDLGKAGPEKQAPVSPPPVHTGNPPSDDTEDDVT